MTNKVLTTGRGMTKVEATYVIRNARLRGGRNPYSPGTHKWSVWKTAVTNPNATVKQLLAALEAAGVKVNEKGVWGRGRVSPSDSVRVRWDRERQRKRSGGTQTDEGQGVLTDHAVDD